MIDIKFRFWNRDLRKMSGIYGLGLLWEHLCEEWDVFDWKDVEKLQYTGLEDKTGAEIFVGDILAIDHSEDLSGGEYVVGFRDGAFEAVKIGDEQFTWCRYWSESQVLIIGNIYAHPELQE